LLLFRVAVLDDVEVLDDADDLEAEDLDGVLDIVLELVLVPAIKYKF
jgi:hypothetical protein